MLALHKAEETGNISCHSSGLSFFSEQRLDVTYSTYDIYLERWNKFCFLLISRCVGSLTYVLNLRWIPVTTRKRLDGWWGKVPHDYWKDSGQQGKTAGAGETAGLILRQPCSSTEGRRKSNQSAHPTQEVEGQDKPHSAFESTGKNFYHKRKTKEEAHLNCRNIEVKDYINLPKPSEDSIWKSFDEQLYEELPTEIGEMHIEQLTNLETQLVRLHNKVRKLELKSQQRKTASKEQHQFRQNPHKYAKRLLNEKQTRSPSFSKTAAEKFFKNVNSDKRRDYKYHPLKGLKRPPKPTKPFKTKPPSLSELNSYLQKRRNASAPGTNRIPYLVWKKCPRTTQLLHEVICGIWRTAAIPMSWRTGETILISKEENTSDPSCFRPITLKNSSGNLGMGILAQRTINYLTNNNYIDQSIQKGFMEKISGCVEHTEALTEMLQDAKKNGKPIVTTWLDLQNAIRYCTTQSCTVRFRCGIMFQITSGRSYLNTMMSYSYVSKQLTGQLTGYSARLESSKAAHSPASCSWPFSTCASTS
ncbi:hypothetical protein BSL78_22020 [Apostichopus japonicus]|uniref:Reverse transcriptase domain-containing protein n=1 Tax=Stichopus japonicus TaxID=307972 RepID=A0A2G8JZD5_STIJA|nr:hypothetical protein BSL78_22020 [Apostichopus japonicus]